MKRSDFDQFDVVSDDVSVRSIQSQYAGHLIVDVYRDRKNGKFYQVQPPMQGNLYRMTAGQGETSEYGEWHKLEEK